MEDITIPSGYDAKIEGNKVVFVKKKPVGCAFEVGDTITDGTSTFEIVGIEDEHYIADDGDKVCFYVAHRYYTPVGHQQMPKPTEWSEEDEIYLQDALWRVKQASKVARGENDMGACWSAERWLKSLPERFK